ncbi:hypothetical protein R1sor_003499 [Riccia sorocarpa]|uniref:Uncharacterized protein n=1 Tax=Riccia sorocarpa TaxID=122646 RepID=A0ABD3H4R1_9MARC
MSMRIEDRKAKFRVKEADEAGPSSEPPKQSSVETSGIKKSVEGARVLRQKYEEFSSQLSEKSEGVHDIFSDTENINKFMFAAQLMWEVAGKHVVDNDVYNSQYSQQVDLASSSQSEREKLERLEERCKEAEATLETLKEDHTVLCAKKHIRAHPGNIDAYIANPDLVPELTVIKSSFETKGDGVSGVTNV